jgi:hypothetical protein
VGAGDNIETIIIKPESFSSSSSAVKTMSLAIVTLFVCSVLIFITRCCRIQINRGDIVGSTVTNASVLSFILLLLLSC